MAMNHDKLVVRLATLADLDFVAQDGYVDTAVIQRKIKADEIFVAEYDNQLVGYLRLEYLWSLVPYIALIHVLPDQQRKGIGKAILQHISAFLRERGHENLYSSSQVDEAEPQAWHRHMGFEECGLLAGINGDGIGELFFCKSIE